MRVYYDIAEYALGPCVLAIGKFNGVHIGHQALLREVVRLARESGTQAVALTFDKHPRALLDDAPDIGSLELAEEDEKIRRIRALGLDALIITKFTQEFSRIPANQYLDALSRALRPRAIVCGEDFRFGKDAGGNVALLRENADRLGYSLVIVPAVTLDGEVVSSTGVIRAMRGAEFDKARAMLSMPPDARPEGIE